MPVLASPWQILTLLSEVCAFVQQDFLPGSIFPIPSGVALQSCSLTTFACTGEPCTCTRNLQYTLCSAAASALQSWNLRGLSEANLAGISIAESGIRPSVFTDESPSCIHGKCWASHLISTLQKMRKNNDIKTCKRMKICLWTEVSESHSGA